MSSSTTTLTAITQTAVVSTSDLSVVGVQISGSWATSLIPELSLDGSNWIAAPVALLKTGSTTSIITTNGLWQTSCAGFSYFRVRVSASMTGSALVYLDSTNGNINNGGYASLSFKGGGTLTGTASSISAAPAMTGSGYLTLVNLDSSNSVAVGLTGVTAAGASTNGFTLLPGLGRTICVADISTWFVNAPTGSLVSWDFLV